MNQRFVICNLFDEKWYESFLAYCAFETTYGCRPSSESALSSEKSLGNWANHQRNKFKAGKVDYQRVRFLDSIGFEWELMVISDWDHSLAEYMDFMDTNGRMPMYSCVDPQEKRLSIWGVNYRQFYKKGQLTPDKMEKIVKSGFPINTDEDGWVSLCASYAHFTKKNSREPSSHSKNYEERSLGAWRVRQWVAIKTNTLPKDRLSKLIDINFRFPIVDENRDNSDVPQRHRE